ncbi:peptidylprolyl isomerase [Cytobacillus sp. FJAT-54145]|uniref:Peptidyl-prolyl cis-trans isomerase n=1 Tax=Cytobacillus spartinae TaxID=3299023 RepID=A0ABW6KFR4_9BACI
MTKKMYAFLLAMILVLAGCGTSPEEKANEQDGTNGSTEEQADTEGVTYPQLSTEVAENERLVEMETSMGTIKIKLFPDHAPKAVENFIKHSESGYYEGIIFHRVIKDFMIQGGDPTGTGMSGESAFGEPFEDEPSDKTFNFRGALSMANSGPNTNGSQFFIVQSSSMDPSLITQLEQLNYPKEAVEEYKNGGAPWLDDEASPDRYHTVFGQVIEGMDIVDQIANVETGEQDKPVEDVVIKKINVLK